MTRFDPNSSAGWVNWPTEGEEWTDAGEGGMFAFAAWPDANNDAMTCTPEYTITMRADFFVGATGPDAEFYTTRSWHDRVHEDHNPHFASLVPIGSTGGTWMRTGEGCYYFTAAVEHVSAEGRRVLDALAALYGAQPLLLTFLDT